MLHSVVYLRVTEKAKDYRSIWKRGSIKSSTGSGSVVKIKDKKFILTNAHCVQDSLFIECIKPENSKVFTMFIYDICPELDLALLESPEDNFWKGLVPIKFTDNDICEGSVFVAGFPQGGANPSVTRGIISRYTHMLYNNSVPNIAIQVDAAINPGNSGGPVFDENNCVAGIAFSHNTGVQSICFMIPTSLVLHYLEIIATEGQSNGVCDLGIDYDPLENIYLRSCLLPSGFSDNMGVIIRNIDVSGSCYKILKEGDILHTIEDTTTDRISLIDQNGMILFNQNRIPYWHLIRLKHVNNTITIHYIRDKKREKVEIILKRIPKLRVPKMNADVSDKYYIFGGLVFQALSHSYIFDGRTDEGNRAVPIKKTDLMRYINSLHEENDDEIVILSEILTSKYNLGYRANNIRLTKVNDILINTLQQLYQICEGQNSSSNKYIKFEFDNNYIIILDWEICLKKSQEIASPYTENYHNFK